MPDAVAMLLLEQDRMRPVLDRLLALAALWMDPEVPIDASAETNGGRALRFAEAIGPRDAPIVAGESLTAAAGHEAPRSIAAVPEAPTTRGQTPLALPTVGDDGTEAGGGPANGTTIKGRTVAQPANVMGIEKASPVPVASLQRLREGRVARGAARNTANASPAGAGPVAARSSPFAALVANAAEDVLPHGNAPQTSSRPFTGEATRSGTTARTSARGVAVTGPVIAGAANAFGTSFPAAVMNVPVGAAVTRRAGGSSPDGSLAEPPGDALEDRLADILERAAAEAGVTLP